MSQCQAPGCVKVCRTKGARYCEMHYRRLHRNGALELAPRELPQRTEHSGGYLLLRAPGHPLETRCGNSRVYEHRAIYYEHYGIGPFCCHWCSISVTWAMMHVDHLDDDPKNNCIDNLVASCPRCNQRRGLPKMRATQAAQGRLLTANGKTQCVSEWAREIGLSPQSILYRLERGWLVERAVSEPRGKFGPMRGALAAKRASSLAQVGG
jgi:hypothetical protein